jgi:hypothetical protein
MMHGNAKLKFSLGVGLAMKLKYNKFEIQNVIDKTGLISVIVVSGPTACESPGRLPVSPT